MGDKELLELAAKADGKYKHVAYVECVNDSDSIHDGNPGLCEIFPNGTPYDVTAWNPLNDDGEALRLAVKLQLTVCNEHIQSGVAYCTRGENEVFKDADGATNGEGEVLEDDYAATRRAIVLVAAEIGKAMP